MSGVNLNSSHTCLWRAHNSGINFEDFRYSFTLVDGNYVRPEFNADKAAGKFKFGQVPTLEVDGVQIVQSKAIERFVAREIGLLNGSNVEVTACRGFCEVVMA